MFHFNYETKNNTIEFPCYVRVEKGIDIPLPTDRILIANKVKLSDGKNYIYISEYKAWYDLSFFIIYLNIKPN